MAAGVTAALVTGAVAAPGVQKGSFSIEQVTTPCTSPAGFCTAGTLRGPLKGTFRFTASSIFATADTPTTAVAHMTGDLELVTADGALTCKDATLLRTTGDKRFSGLCVVVAGTGAFLGAQGTLSTAGSLTAGEGDYEARIGLP